MPVPKGTRIGGRQKGTLNKRTRQLQESIASSGITPLDFMLQIMRMEIPEDAPVRERVAASLLKLDAAKAAAPYVHPRLASVEVTGKDGGPLEVSVVRFSDPAKQVGTASLPNEGLGGSRTGLPPSRPALASPSG